ncbi:M24 family metallopeptidase [Chloroflexota bacterium]
METMQPTLKRGRDVWDQINMPRAEFLDRVSIIKKVMQKEGVDVLLLYGNGVDEYGNTCYISNFITAMSRGALVIIPLEGDVVLIFEGASRGLPAAKATTWVEDVRPSWDISGEVVKYLQEKNLLSSTVGFVGLRKLMPYDQLSFLYKSLEETKIVDSNHIIRDMRITKSGREYDQIRRASRIVNQAFNFISSNLSINISERTLEAAVDRIARLEAAEDFRMLIAKPLEENWALRPAEDVQILQGDTIIIFLAVEFERYWSEGIRTFFAGPDSLTLLDTDTTGQLYSRIMDGMKAGKAASQFYTEAIGELSNNSVGFMPEYSLGQGIGLSLQESPIISEGDTTPLAEGMCLTVHLAARDNTTGAVMIGNTVYLSENGPEVLTE